MGTSAPSDAMVAGPDLAQWDRRAPCRGQTGEGARAPGLLGAGRRTAPRLVRAVALALASCVLAGGGAGGESPPAAPAGTIPRFAFEPNPIGLTGAARTGRFMEASGRSAAFLGREDGGFEAWAYPLKVLHDFHLAFAIAAYADPIPAASLAATVDIRPEAVTVRYAMPPSRSTRPGWYRSTSPAAWCCSTCTPRSR